MNLLNFSLSCVVAVAKNNIIGNNNQLLWHISDDLKRFKQLTSGSTVIMGRKTYESLKIKPLPNRKNIILTSNKHFDAPNCVVIHSIEDCALHLIQNQENFVIGGGEIYNLMLPYCQRIYLTLVHQDFEGDTRFPHLDNKQWQVITDSGILKDEKSGLQYQYLTYQRK